MSFRDIVVSGTRPTGNLHLGNYLGAVKQFVAMQDKGDECYFFIADLHSLTTHPNPKDFSASIKTVLVEYLAAGLDPEKISIYLQSDLPQIPELYLFLNMHAYIGELERVTTFKDKVRSQPDNVNAGLLTYPTLMAADILIHKGTRVPVGKDQEQHLEMTRVYARRFNHLYEREVFPESQAYSSSNQLVKIPSLDGSGKMSKSENLDSCIFLADSPEEILRKFKKAKTETVTSPNQPISEAVQNLFLLLEQVSGIEAVDFYKEEYNNASIRFGDLKNDLASSMSNYLLPIRERIKEFHSNEKYLKKAIQIGTEKAIISANKTILEVKDVMGFPKFK